MRFEPTHWNNMKTANDPERRTGYPQSTSPDGDPLEIEFQTHWSTQLVNAWIEFRRIERNLGWDVTFRRERPEAKAKGKL